MTDPDLVLRYQRSGGLLTVRTVLRYDDGRIEDIGFVSQKSDAGACFPIELVVGKVAMGAVPGRRATANGGWNPALRR